MTGTAALRVLVVDDNPLNLDLAAFVLRQAGFEVALAADGVQALAQLQREQPDAVLMDIQMPGIVVVAFTAFAMKGDEQRMRAAGCDGYVSKPIDVASFAGTVRAIIEAARTS